MTTVDILEQQAREQGARTAIAALERRISYSELNKGSNKIANTLINLGVEKGDRIAVLLPLVPELIVSHYGIIKTGGITVPIDVRFPLEDIDFVIKDCEPKVLIGESPFLQTLVSSQSSFASVKNIIDWSPTAGTPFRSAQEILASDSSQSPGVNLKQEDIAAIGYTSGTTGHPKGAMMSHQALARGAEHYVRVTHQTQEDVFVFFALPPSWPIWIFGSTLLTGGAAASVASSSLNEFLETVDKAKGTIIFAMSFICAEMVNMPEEEIKKYDLSSLRLCLSGGAPIPKDILHRFKDRFGLDIILGHGMMEILGWNTAQPLDGSGKLGSVGKVQWGKELKIVDEAGKTLPPNHTGEIIISAPSMMMTGYYNRPRATAEVIREGWLYTGDIGYLDEDGYLFISGRKKEMLTVARKMIAPVDIEEVLYSHPKVAEAAIVGISETTGEAIRAVIVLKKGEEATSAEMEQFCREHLADYQMPKEFVFRESLPRNPMGKVRREELKK